jgi:hypothetical protein
MISIILVFIILAGLLVLFNKVMAAPALAETRLQTSAQELDYVSVSALAFEAVSQNTAYIKDAQRQILSLASQNLSGNIFIAPLLLPDRGQLLGLTVFGEDFDNQGEIRLRLKRCDHSQARCVTLAETNSTLGYAAGPFETIRVSLLNEIVDNRLYSYFLELELTALFNSGLRSARLEMMPPGVASPVSNQERWSLAGDARSFSTPNLGLAQVRICADDLSHLDNVTHYPFVVVDRDQTIPLSSNSCITVWGTDIAIQRRANTGPSSGTFQILR